uniref:DNA ligase IV n=1 Tax=Parastrongyloides trichosuri TaxID=131310 RepID=A0A0N5A1E6_PARTI
MEISKANSVLFVDLCSLLEEMEKSDEKKTKEQLFKSFVATWFFSKLDDNSIYPVINMMVPHFSFDLMDFDINDLYKIILKEKGLKESHDFMNLSLSGEIMTLVNLTSNTIVPKLSIGFVNDYIEAIFEGDNVYKRIVYLFNNVSNVERKWIITILLQKVEISINFYTEQILYLLHPLLVEMKNEGYGLSKILSNFHPDNFIEREFVNEVRGVQLFKPFPGMKYISLDPSRESYNKIVKFCRGKLLAEKFYDCSEVIVHRRLFGKEYKFYSDNMKDYTPNYTSDTYNFAAELHPYFRKDLQNFIIQGKIALVTKFEYEILGKHDPSPDDCKYSVFHLNKNNRHVKLCFILTDLLCINEDILIDRPLEVRLKILREKVLFKTDKRTIFIPEQKEIKNYDDYFECVRMANICLHTGFIVRDSKSLYTPGKIPINHGYYKIEEDLSKSQDLTLAIVGVEFSGHKQEDIMKYYYLAARNQDGKLKICLKSPCPSKSSVFHNIANNMKIFTKYYTKLPSWLESNYPATGRERYVYKENQVYVNINWFKYDEGSKELIFLQRFTDKDLSALSTVKEIEYYGNKLNKRLSLKEIIPNELENTTHNENTESVDVVNTTFRDYFNGLTICVLNCPQDYNIKKVQNFIFALGANVVASPTEETTFLIAHNTKNPKTMAACKRAYVPVLNIEWAIRCISEKKLQKICLKADVILQNAEKMFSFEGLNQMFDEVDIPEDVIKEICI